MSRCILFLILLFAINILSAQILNIDKRDTADYVKKAKWGYQLSAGLEIDQQKTTLYDATNTAEVLLQKNKNLFIFSGSFRFTYNGPSDILNSGFVHLRYRYQYKNKFQPEPYIQYQWDNQRGLIHRALAGANLRYNLWRGDKFDFNTGLGLMAEQERWDYSAVDSVKIPLNAVPIQTNYIKLNSYIRLDWKSSHNSDLAFNLFVQARPDNFKPRIAPHIQWNIDAGKHLGFSIAYSGLYDVQPVVPIRKFYYSLSNSILLKL